jgi:hypothetical protein
MAYLSKLQLTYVKDRIKYIELRLYSQDSHFKGSSPLYLHSCLFIYLNQRVG